jgi:hypothetical protein
MLFQCSRNHFEDFLSSKVFYRQLEKPLRINSKVLLVQFGIYR